MKEKIISGIQQVGIGVPNVKEAWIWYKEHFGVDIRMFEEAAVAELMLPYTGGKPQKRHAALALNMQGGGGFEIWQYTDRVPEFPKFEIQVGDLGIFAVKIKSKDVRRTSEKYQSQNLNLVGEITKDPRGKEHFYLKDLYNNIFEIVPSDSWFKNEKKLTGAAYGAIIGVSDMNKSLHFYSDILGYDEIVYDQTGIFEDLMAIAGGSQKMRRVLLRHSKPRLGAFSPLFGRTQIELIQTLEREPKKIYHERFWGDLGFIHICFDITGMGLLREECQAKGHPFTVDTKDSFDMGEAAGAFSYTEDPDGTLIEFVETHKIPVWKKMGWYINLQKRNPHKSLPRWILKSISFNRVKDF
ncbi:MAG: VOC family protein [Bacteroidales bacterium]|nr:VOC family protein [Bacteroidales bacterium]